MWTIFGAGNLVFDIIDAIISHRSSIGKIVINQPINKDILEELDYWPIVDIKDYIFEGESSIFGFVDPNKENFLSSLKNHDFNNLIHAKAHVGFRAYLDEGNYLAVGSIIASKVSMQNFNYINRNATIGHHTTLQSFNHIGPGAIVCGRCKIGSRNFIGAGSIIKDGITIGDNVTIGAGAVVVKDILEPGTYIGTPARKL